MLNILKRFEKYYCLTPMGLKASKFNEEMEEEKAIREEIEEFLDKHNYSEVNQ